MNAKKIRYENLNKTLNSVNKNINEANKRMESFIKNIEKGISTPYSTKDKYINIEKGLNNIKNNIEMLYIPEVEKELQKLA